MSANKQLEPILGYSFEGKMPDEINNNGVKFLLDGYASTIDSINQLKSTWVNPKWDQILNNQFLKSTNTTVGPLLKTKWNQGYPYNLMCPKVSEGSDNHTLTGCVATALAQIMKYYEFPQKGFGTYSYSHSIYGEQTADYENTFYDWDNMLNEYNGASSKTEQNAVSQLMYHCGVFTEMDYGTDGSTTSFSSIPYSFFENFNYSLPILINHDIYPISSLTSIIKQEIDEKRPVLYGAQNSETGSRHALVCDGYDGDYLHFNFGWGGTADGYYYMDETSPALKYIENYYAIINIKPDDGSNVRKNTLWEGSLKFDGRVGVGKDANLSIRPGTKIEFGRNGGLAVYGVINSIGTKEDPIIFTAKDTLLGWQGIELNNALQKKSNPDSSRILNSTIEYAKASYISAQVMCGFFNWVTSALQVTNYDNLRVDSSLFRYNTGTFRGTAIYLYNSHSRISNSQFYKNDGQASIILINAEALDKSIKSPIIENNIFKYNTERDLGIITIENHSRPIIDRNIFHDNRLGRSGAIHSYRGSVSTITNNLIYNNSRIQNFYPQTHLFAGIECYASSSKIFNNTIVNNRMFGVSVFENCDVTFRNNIIWGNSNKSFRIGRGAKLDIQYCNIYEGKEGFSYYYLDEPGDTKLLYKNNISVEPGFISEHNFELNDNSQCLNNGTPYLSELLISDKDLRGNKRVFGGRIDIGAYENQNIVAKDDVFFNPDSVEFISNISELDTSNIDIIYINNSKISGIEELSPPFDLKLSEDSTQIFIFIYSDIAGEYVDTLKINSTTGMKMVPIKAWIGKTASGEVFGDWNSPYIKITGDIIVPDGKTLIIYPGTTIDFLGHYKVDVKGRLLAVGDSANYIRFTSQKELVGWKGIRFDKTNSLNDTSKIEFCILENGITQGESIEMHGGAIFVSYFSKLIVSDCIIRNNDADSYLGGAIFLKGADIIVQRNMLIDNIGGYGGAISIISSNPKILCNYISGNWSNHGGGLLIEGNCTPLVSNNVISNNIAGYGGAICLNRANPLIFNNTIIDNKSRQDGGGIYMWFNSNPIINGNIIYENQVTADYVYDEPNKVQISMADDSNHPACYFNNIQGGSKNIFIAGKDLYHGAYLNNIDADPVFKKGDAINCKLSATSPCINTGESDLNLNDLGTTVDFLGNYRIFGENIDIGAIEYYPASDITGINDVAQNQINLIVIPNPNDGKFRLRFENGKTGKNQVNIINELGQVQFKREIYLTDYVHEEEFELSHLSSGIYLIKVFDGERTKTQKFVIR